MSNSNSTPGAKPETFRRVVAKSAFEAIVWGLTVWILAAHVAALYKTYGGFTTGAFFALAIYFLSLMLRWFTWWASSNVRKHVDAAGVETDEERAARVMEVMTRLGSDKLSNEDLDFAHRWAARLSEQSRDAQRAHLQFMFKLRQSDRPMRIEPVPMPSWDDPKPFPAESLPTL